MDEMTSAELNQYLENIAKLIEANVKDFCLNNLLRGGCIGHVYWTMAYLENYFAEDAIRYDVLHETGGIYRF